MGNTTFLDLKFSIVFDLTIQQDKKGLAFFSGKKDYPVLHRRFCILSAIINKVLFPICPIFFLNMNT